MLPKQSQIRNQYPVAILLLTLSGPGYATSLGISYGQQDYQVTTQNEAVTLSPDSRAVSLSIDLNNDWNLALDYQQGTDEQTFENRVNVDVELQNLGGSLSYYLDNWSFTSSYSASDINTVIAGLGRQSNRRLETTKSTAIGGSVGYGFATGNWFYNLSVAGGYSDWDYNKLQFIYPLQDQTQNLLMPATLTEKIAGDATSVSSSVSVARFWSLSANTGVLVGGLFSWNYLVSGDSVLISRHGLNLRPNNINQQRAINNSSLNSISGDDSSGQFSIYLSYDLTPSWSMDLDSSVNIASDYTAHSWSVGFGYVF